MGDRTVNAVIQARMDSTRLPGKVLMDIEGLPILEHVIRRLSAIEEINAIIVATSTKASDNAVELFCQNLNIPCVRGSEENVLHRFGAVSDHFPADIYIRATGDNPMIDILLIHDMLKFFTRKRLSYTCYKQFPIGSGVEIFTHEALIEALQQADQPFELEHVTPYMYQRMPGKKVEYFRSNVDDSRIRMTVDTEDDLIFAKEIFSRLYKDTPLFGISDIKQLLQQEPHLIAINEQVHQKTLGD